MAGSPVADRTQRAEAAKAARREEILDAAHRVFAERGFRGTTIADVAEEARIALGTIYLYFPSKEDLFAALGQRLADLIGGAFTAPPMGETLDEIVRDRVTAVFDVCRRHSELVRLVVLNTDPGSAVAERVRAAEQGREQPLAAALERAMQGGYIRQGDPAVMAKLITGLVTIAVYQAFVISDGRDADTLEGACADMAVAYLRPQTQGEGSAPGTAPTRAV